MTSQLPAQPSRATLSALEDLVPRPMLFPDESRETYADLRDALLSDLAPASPYEWMLAEEIVTLQWEIIRHRRIRDTIIMTKVRDLAIGLFATGEISEVSNPESEHRDLARALVKSGSQNGQKALVALYQNGVTQEELVAQAYSLVSDRVDLHDRKRAALEKSRDRLRETYDRLKAARRTPVEDAEVVE